MLAKLLAPFKGGEKKVKEKTVKKMEKKEEVCSLSIFCAPPCLILCFFRLPLLRRHPKRLLLLRRPLLPPSLPPGLRKLLLPSQ